ncbi:MAG TPA: hypothetical protein VFS23_14465, partial [Vicinamibacterales bacterium]|nr:hypothetical protein [Vicinamibacterales bacterium]
DLDLWRPIAPGRDEQFDASRFGLWLEVMVDADVSSAASTLAAMDSDLVAAGFAQPVRVFVYGAAAPFITLEGDVSPGLTFGDTLRTEVGGYVVLAKRGEFWDAITTVLIAMADAHGDAFNQIMRRCCRQSNSLAEVDGLDELLTTSDQAMFEVALDREARRDTEGYVTPAQARAFLQASRRIDRQQTAKPPRDPMTGAYFRSEEARTAPERDAASRELPPRNHVEGDPPPEAVAAILELLHEAGAMPRTPRALLEAPQRDAPRLALIQVHLQFAHDHDADAYAMRSAELAYLANVIAAGSTIQSRPLLEDEASNAAVAVCNLGLENWPVHWRPGGIELPEDFLIRQDLVGVFQVGWTVLHEDVCMYAADELIGVLQSVRCADRDVDVALQALRIKLTKHLRAGSPWEAGAAFDVIATLDTPAWAALLGLIAQLPTLHMAVGALLARTTSRIDAAGFEFISENRHVQQARDFMRLLPALLNH